MDAFQLLPSCGVETHVAKASRDMHMPLKLKVNGSMWIKVL